MSQFGAASKNPPWARTTDVTGVTVTQQQLQTQMMNQLGQQGIMYQQTPQVFQSALGIQQPANMMPAINSGTVSLAGLNTAQLYGQPTTVSYPVPRSLNSTAFGAGPVAPAVQQVQQSTPNQPNKQRVFTGTVTKVHDNFGFVDEDVFFQMSCCVKGSNPVVGDRVLVEASYNPNMPFKWNATRLQVLPMSGQLTGSGTGRKGFSDTPNNYSTAPPPVDRSNDVGPSSFGRSRSPRRDRPRREHRDSDDDRKRRREEHERSKEREKSEKEKGSTRSPSVRKRSKSPRKRRVRPAPRYMVHVPKIALDVPEADVLELRRRYNNLYIPSDFFVSNFRWVDAFPPNTPFTMDRPCSFHIMHRDTEQVTENKAVLDPPDADYLFSAKVMLMSMPEMGDFLKKCCQMTEDIDPDSESEGRDFVHPTRLVNFLVGLRGKNETMAIGGPWSPSLDGPNPDKDPQVLIRTAIRNCQALTGIDLSTCTQWYRFLEIYYRRSETTHKGKLVAARVETVVLFLPDVWSCVPTRLEWDGLHLNYKRQLDRKLKALLQMDTDEEAGIADEKEGEDGVEIVKKEPTHWSHLDPKVMKVSDLRQELEARNMPSKGLKSQLTARMLKVLKTEQETEEKGEDDDEGSHETEPEPEKMKDKEEDDEKKKKEDEERKKQVEKEKGTLEKRYELPENPHILVHPNRHAKSGKFDCTTMSLSLLLDYRQDDTKEHSFEVSLFAELFNEMLMRDFGFRIYRALYEAAEKIRDEEKEKERKKKEEKEKKEKDEKDKKEKDDKDKKEDENAKDGDSESKTDEDTRDKETSEDGDRKEREGEKEKEDRDEKRDRRDRDSKDRDRDKKKKEKLFTFNPQLLLAFVYFDQSHCGYILDKDIEELMYALGLNLSRAQVRRLLQAVITKDSRDSRESREALHYRRLTDKPKVEENGTSENAMETESIQPTNLEKLAFGNKRLLPVFASHQGGSPPSKRARLEPSDSSSSDQVPEGFVMFKGGLLDVEKLLVQLKRSENARTDTENMLISLRDELNDVKKSATVSSNNVKQLTFEVKDFKERLQNTADELNKVQAKSHVYLVTLKDMHAKIGKVLPVKTESSGIKSEPSDEDREQHVQDA